ncbi:hypothetical protein HID58_005197 [Brassica napus]|uniref:Uncharacterized protein n=1 Tax=Brassica napus TaxID=3708 RepID=A0ABQ8E7Z7_BRANA|nr:hypothetical protein HID58_005197 [Brassica napus]
MNLFVAFRSRRLILFLINRNALSYRFVALNIFLTPSTISSLECEFPFGKAVSLSLLRLWEARDVRRGGDFFSLTKGNRNYLYGRRYALLDAKDITEEKKSYPCPTEWLFSVDIIPLRRRGIEFFWFDGKLGQKSEEKVLKDSMKPSQNSSASVSETWSRTESNRIFTRLLNGTISLQPYLHGCGSHCLHNAKKIDKSLRLRKKVKPTQGCEEPKEKSLEEREGLKTVEWEVEVVSVDPIVRALCRNREDRITPSEDRTYMIRTVQEMHQTMLTVYFLPIALFMVQWQDVDKANVLDESAQFLGPTDIIKEKKEVPEKLLKKTGMEFLIFLRLLKRSLSEAQKSNMF